jgi:hypothetical protein
MREKTTPTICTSPRCGRGNGKSSNPITLEMVRRFIGDNKVALLYRAKLAIVTNHLLSYIRSKRCRPDGPPRAWLTNRGAPLIVALITEQEKRRR